MQVARSFSHWSSTVWLLAKLAIFVLALRTLLFSPYLIPSESMQPGLLRGDYILVAKWPYGYGDASLPFGLEFLPGRLLFNPPQRGDIVVIAPKTRGADAVIKRVIGLPGETIALNNGLISINGEPVERVAIAEFIHRESPNSPCDTESFRRREMGREDCVYPQFLETLPNGVRHATLALDATAPENNMPELVIPENQLFLIGDNRDRSADSRFAADRGGLGPVPQDALIGRAFMIIFSTDGSAEWLKPWTWFSAARPERIGTLL